MYRNTQRIGLLLMCCCVMWVGLIGCPAAPPLPEGAADATEGTITPEQVTNPEELAKDALPPDSGSEVPPERPDASTPELPSSGDDVPRAAATLLLEGGNNQRGEVGQPLLQPLTVRYIDRFDKGIADAEIVFTLIRGNGGLDGTGASTTTVKTDAQGRASVSWTMGSATGFQQQVVQAQHKDGAQPTIGFVASAFVAGPAELTRFAGVVINNKAQPLAGVSVYLVNNNLKSDVVKTDANGQFALDKLKDFVGQSHLVIDGTTEPSSAIYPRLEYEVFNIAGIENRLDGPAPLPALDPAGTVQVDETKTTEVKPPTVPDLRMIVAAGSALFSDKKKSGTINITKVDPYWIPMPPPNGYASSIVVTIQPSDVRFDPPAPISFPNADKMPPGKRLPIFSFDHAKGKYVQVAIGQVSADGKRIDSLPGQGIVRGGWHLVGIISPASTTAFNLPGAEVQSAMQQAIATTNKRQDPAQPIGTTTDAGDPVQLNSGAFVLRTTDLAVPSRGMPFRFVRSYHSRIQYHGVLGHNWDHNYHKQLRFLANGNVEYDSGAGRIDTFPWDATQKTFQSPPQLFATLLKLPNGNLVLKWPQGKLYTFDHTGALRKIEDRFGNTLQFSYNLKQQLSLITDSVDRPYQLFYNEDGHLARLIDFAGRTVTYTYDAQGDLISVTSPATPRFAQGKTIKYTYSSGLPDPLLNHNLLTITDAKQQTYLTHKYNNQDRVIEQIFGPGTYKFDYQAQTPGGDPKDLNTVHMLTSVTDPENNVVKYHFNRNGNPLKIEQISRKLRPNAPVAWTFTARYNANGRLLEMIYPNGNSTLYTYDEANPNRLAHGNVIAIERKSHLPQDPHKSLKYTYTYEGTFQLRKTATSPRGNCTGCDPKRFTTTYLYDYEEATLGDLNGDGVTNGNAGYLVKIQRPTATLPDSKTQAYEVLRVPNKYGQTTQTTDAMGMVTTFDYYASNNKPGDPADYEGYLKTITRDQKQLKLTHQFAYDLLGNITAYTNPNGHTTRYLYNPRRQRIARISPAPFLYKTLYTYDANDKLEELRFENKLHDKTSLEHPYLTIKWKRNVLDRVIEVQREVEPGTFVTHKWERDKLQRVTKRILPQGNAICIDRDERGLPISVTSGCGSPAAVKNEYDFDFNRNLVSVKRPNGQTLQHKYDGYNRLSAVIDAIDTSLNFVRDEDGHLVSYLQKGTVGGKKDTTLKQIDFAYDERGRRTKREAHLFTTPGSSITKLVTQWFFDPSGRLTKQIDPRGNAWEYQYDTAHRLQKRITPEGDAVEFKRDPKGDVIETIAFAKSTNVRASDKTYSVKYKRDEHGRLTQRINARSYTHEFRYNSRGQIIEYIDPEGEVRKFIYDGLGRLIERIKVLRFQGKVVGQISSKREFDHNGRLTATIDGNGNKITFAYNERNRRTSQTYPTIGTLTAQKTWTYDINGRLQTMRDPNGSTHTYTYDAVSRLGRIDIARANGIAGETFRALTYDPCHRLIEAKNDFATTTFAYDSLNRKLSETTNGATNTLKYDEANNPVEFALASGTKVLYTFDKNNRMRSTTKQGQTAPVAILDYIGSAPVHTTLANGVTEERTLDDIGRTAAQIFLDKNKQRIRDFAYTYNKANKIIAREDRKDPSSNQVYHRDSIYRILAHVYGVLDVVKELATPGSQAAKSRVELLYDNADNRTQTKSGTQITRYITNARNQTTKLDNTTRTYSPNGEVTSDGTHQYIYNALAQVISVVNILSQQTIADYKHDAFGRNIEKKTATETTHSFYVGQVKYLEQDPGTKLYADFLRSPYRNDLFAVTNAATTTYPLPDLGGAFAAYTDSTGTVATNHEIDPFLGLHTPIDYTPLRPLPAKTSSPPITSHATRHTETGNVHQAGATFQPSTGTTLQPNESTGATQYKPNHTKGQAFDPDKYFDPIPPTSISPLSPEFSAPSPLNPGIREDNHLPLRDITGIATAVDGIDETNLFVQPRSKKARSNFQFNGFDNIFSIPTPPAAQQAQVGIPAAIMCDSGLSCGGSEGGEGGSISLQSAAEKKSSFDDESIAMSGMISTSGGYSRGAPDASEVNPGIPSASGRISTSEVSALFPTVPTAAPTADEWDWYTTPWLLEARAFLDDKIAELDADIEGGNLVDLDILEMSDEMRSMLGAHEADTANADGDIAKWPGVGEFDEMTNSWKVFGVSGY